MIARLVEIVPNEIPGQTLFVLDPLRAAHRSAGKQLPVPFRDVVVLVHVRIWIHRRRLGAWVGGGWGRLGRWLGHRGWGLWWGRRRGRFAEVDEGAVPIHGLPRRAISRRFAGSLGIVHSDFEAQASPLRVPLGVGPERIFRQESPQYDEDQRPSSSHSRWKFISNHMSAENTCLQMRRWTERFEPLNLKFERDLDFGYRVVGFCVRCARETDPLE